MHIGIDLDNTLVCYDRVIYRIARERGLIDEKTRMSKAIIRDIIQQLPDGDQKWMKIQADIYGPLIVEAEIYEGALDFIKTCFKNSFKISIISHKTQYAIADPHGIDLREAAINWLQEMGFFLQSGLSFQRQNIHFTDSREEKIQLIDSLGCHLFIDDLYELLSDTKFPCNVDTILFDPSSEQNFGSQNICRSWSEIHKVVIDG